MMGNNDQIPMDDDADIQVTLTLDDGSEVDCEILTIFEMEGQDYIVLIPSGEEGQEDEGQEEEVQEVYLYRYYESEDGEPSLENIEDDEEYACAADFFDELMEQMDDEELS